MEQLQIWHCSIGLSTGENICVRIGAPHMHFKQLNRCGLIPLGSRGTILWYGPSWFTAVIYVESLKGLQRIRFCLVERLFLLRVVVCWQLCAWEFRPHKGFTNTWNVFICSATPAWWKGRQFLQTKILKVIKRLNPLSFLQPAFVQ